VEGIAFIIFLAIVSVVVKRLPHEKKNPALYGRFGRPETDPSPLPPHPTPPQARSVKRDR
jgi:hypothetical protein